MMEFKLKSRELEADFFPFKDIKVPSIQIYGYKWQQLI